MRMGLSAAAINVRSPRDPNSGSAVGLKVDSTLPIDPISLTFTDSQGRVVHPSTLNWSWGASQTGSYLRSGETYAVSVDGCSGDPNLQIKLVLDGMLVTHLVDVDGDGRYSGSFTYNPAMQAAAAGADSQLRLVVSRQWSGAELHRRRCDHCRRARSAMP